MVEYGFAIEAGKEMFFSVDPEMIYATKNIYDISHKKRQCYLDHEKTLAYYQHYGFLNCFMECASNFTIDVRSTYFQTNTFLKKQFHSTVAALHITCHGIQQKHQSVPLSTTHA